MKPFVVVFSLLQCASLVLSGTAESGFASIRTNCSKDFMDINLTMEKPFKGLIFAKGFYDECGVKGDLSTSLKLSLPVSGCGVRSEMNGDKIEYSVRLVAQMDHKLQTKTDLETVARCALPSKMMDVKIVDPEPNKIDLKHRNGRMNAMKAMQENSTTRVRAWMELGGINGIGSVEVGQNTTLSVHLVLARKYGVKVVDCICFDGVGEISQKLFDEFGCPIDSQIMPQFKEYIKNLEDGWSQPDEDDMVQKTFETNFPAFKFPDREILHLTCGIQLCNGICAKRPCRQIEEESNDLDEHLARIEVFNSLKVLAPQIEIDRPSQNLTALPARYSFVSSDVLCISSNKLAMAFCILGLIFLIAVIIAISCSFRHVRSRRRNRSISGSNSDQSGRRSIFSVVSTDSQQSSRINSKLFSYGRVY